jgi:hypothetical protein
MQWSDVTKAPSPKMLRQFAGLWLVVFGGWAVWRLWHGQTGVWTDVLAIGAVVVGGAGLIAPAVVRPIYIGWMIAAFPIGWTISKIVIGLMFYLVFTPVAFVFKLMGRDVLHLKRGEASSYWGPKSDARSGKEYMRQY